MNDFVYSQMYLMDSHASNGISMGWQGEFEDGAACQRFKFIFLVGF